MQEAMEENGMFPADDADDVLVSDGDDDVPMSEQDEDDDQDEELKLHDDITAYFDGHKDSVFAIAAHPQLPHLVATGGSEGDTAEAPGKGYVLDTSVAASRPVLPASYQADTDAVATPTELRPVFELDGHEDSISALTFTLPDGDFLVSGGMDGRVRLYAVTGRPVPAFSLAGEARETDEVNWLAACPSASHANVVAVGSSDGSVWIFSPDGTDERAALQVLQSYFLHAGPCTAGAWTADGDYLATVAEDGSLHVFDVWGRSADGRQTVVSLTGRDGRFAVEGGLFAVATHPGGNAVAVGGQGGAIRIVGLPGGGLLAALEVQTGGIETLAFAASGPGPVLLAAGGVDGSIAVLDASRGYALRRHIEDAHDGESLVRIEFVCRGDGRVLTSCGLDGVVRRWDLLGGGGAANGLVGEWKGHRGGVLDFVQDASGSRVTTAGDDGLVLVFET